jgi:hydrophobe/amphiphile efflux-3 (HAE3) family protein
VSVGRALAALAGGAARRPRLTLCIALALGAGAVVLALRLHPTAATSTFVSSGSSQYRATQRYYRSFGEEPVEVLVQGDLQKLVLSEDIVRLLGLEGCLSGNVPSAALSAEGGAGGPCGQLARAHTVKLVLGPGTFINEAASHIDTELSEQTRGAQAQASQAKQVIERAALAQGIAAQQARSLGEQASKATLGRFEESIATLALRYGLTSQPSISEPNFVSTLVFDSSKPAGTPKQRFAYLFPSRNSALVSVRMRAGLSEAQRKHTIALIRQAVTMPQWHLQHGESYLVTGEPVIVTDLTSSITRSLELLLAAVVLVMAAALGLIFAGRPRLLPLALALLACALTFGALSLAGGPLALASVAVLPVLVGLAVDYAIQFQSRVGEVQARTAGAARRVPAIERAAGVAGPTLLTAAAAGAAAMLALLLSPVPMVRGFAVLLIAGVAIALLCALTAGAAALALARAPGTAAASASGAIPRRQPRGALAGAYTGATSLLAPAWRGARELVLENPFTRLLKRAALADAVRRPALVLGVGLALAALGWGLDTQTRVETDITKLVPQQMSSLRALNTLERATGVGGEIDLMISGADVTRPSTIEWMSRYESATLARFGYSAARGCGRAQLCPAFSLPDLFTEQGGSKLSRARVTALLAAIPPYFSQDVITPDHRVATLAFGIRLMGLSAQQRLIEQMRAGLHPPAGVSATLVGLPVLAAQSGAQVASAWRRVLTLLVGLAAVALVLAAAFRGDRRRVLVPLVPIALATGWSALIVFAVRLPLNPMSVTLSALVIAISTEFSVLLSERHRQERLAGYDTVTALRRAYGRTGAAVAASGVTAIAGFGVLALSDIRMLRDFGLLTLIDLSVSLLGVAVALPAALVLADAPARGVREEIARLRAGLRRAPAAVRARTRPRSAGSGHEPA